MNEFRFDLPIPSCERWRKERRELPSWQSCLLLLQYRYWRMDFPKSCHSALDDCLPTGLSFIEKLLILLVTIGHEQNNGKCLKSINTLTVKVSWSMLWTMTRLWISITALCCFSLWIPAAERPTYLYSYWVPDSQPKLQFRWF